MVGPECPYVRGGSHEIVEKKGAGPTLKKELQMSSCGPIFHLAFLEEKKPHRL